MALTFAQCPKMTNFDALGKFGLKMGKFGLKIGKFGLKMDKFGPNLFSYFLNVAPLSKLAKWRPC